MPLSLGDKLRPLRNPLAHRNRRHRLAPYVWRVIQDFTTSDDVRHANGRPVIFSVHSQTSAINFGSRESGLDLAGLDLTKYSPETCATSGEVARYRDTAAPCFEFSMNGFSAAPISLPMSVALQI